MNTLVKISEKHKIVGVPASEELIRLFPEAVQLQWDNQIYIALPHDPSPTFWLRKMGYDVPAPILSHYDFPHPANEPPFEVQKKTCALMTMESRAYVLNDMGTGKTRAALWSWDYLYSKGACKKLLVVATLSNLNFVWGREAFATLPHRKYAILHHSSRKKRLERLQTDAEIFIINHDGLKLIDEEILARGDIDCLVLDEMAVYRNASADRTKKMRKFAAHFGFVWGMTGSPIPTAPTDAWAQATIVTPNTVPKYFGAFRSSLMLKVNDFKWVPKPDATEKAFAALQPAVRFTLDDVVELPDCIERFQDVELGPIQAKIYKQMVDHCKISIANHEITAVNAGAVMMKLLQISLGWIYNKEGGTVSLDNNTRIEALMDVIRSTNRKVLVFSPFKHALAGISDALTSESIEHATVSGDTSLNERSQVFNLFENTDKYKVLNAHPVCLAHGITLNAADTIVWFGPVTSLETYAQANARIRRVGQRHKQQIIHFQGTPVERRMYHLLHTNQKVQDKLLSMFEEATERTVY